jgi:hypothetical protein
VADMHVTQLQRFDQFANSSLSLKTMKGTGYEGILPEFFFAFLLAIGIALLHCTVLPLDTYNPLN